MTDQNKLHEYRDLIEQWAEWWSGPGRESYRHPVIPPLTDTSNALRCMFCNDVTEFDVTDDNRCAVCGRDVTRKALRPYP